MTRPLMEEAADGFDLTPPTLFQAPDSVLDLHDINPDDPVVISFWLPRAAENGEQVQVNIGEGFSFPFKASDPQLGAQDATVTLESLPPTGKAYDVYYTFREQESPRVSVMFLDTTLDFLGAFRNGVGLYGTYSKGALGAWVVPISYRLRKDMPFIRGIGEKRPAKGPSGLNISRKTADGYSEVIGTITYAVESGEWSIDMSGDVNLGRGDLVSVVLADEAPCFVSFAMNI